MKSLHAMPFGATVIEGGGVRFAFWAPDAERVWLERGTDAAPASHEMARTAEGWHLLELADARAGERYRYRLPDGLRVPDPASRCNPDDVHGPSQVVDPRTYRWRDGGWHGRPWHEAVVYELHVGTFTPEGSFAAARERLPELAELGITAIELMPLADFPGQRNWGYDGVLPFAPDASYGTPDDLKALIDAAHALGLMVLLDVVYNHFGPEGNYLHAYCTQFFNPLHATPWGPAINYDAARSRTVRDFFVHNALYWIEEFHFDGLRMDAVHAIRDDTQPDIVREICAALHAGPGRHRAVHVVLENELNQAGCLARGPDGAPLVATAQWNDDLHHAAHVLATGETDGYYADYADAPVDRFGRALAEGFVYQGEPSRFRAGEARGEPSTHLPLAAFVSFLQTHDQVGNRAFGERIHALADPVLLRAAQACLLLSPHVPMFFMGEEFAASTPFLYFCDFEPALAAAVSQGRRGEFSRFAAFADQAARERIPDPNAESTFRASQLRWEERCESPHRERLATTRELLALRRRWLVPRLAAQRGAGRFWREGEALRVEWPLGGEAAARLHLLAHFGRDPLSGMKPPPGRTVYEVGVTADGAMLHLAPGAVRFTLQETNDVG
ncbi:MAG: malto-oligosyltrehalose trehalohydrolase [Variovorax sp.]|nr:malto-oligosyltrehalose trehalohydrolase [Variovorax sp.]